MKWFAIHVRRFREALAASSVAALGLEVFLPMIKVECSKEAVIKVGSKPLFPSYLFARFNPDLCLSPVEGSRGVLYVIKSGALPIPVGDQVVREIQERVAPDGLIRLQQGTIKPGDRVSIEAGPFAGMMGRMEAELDDRSRVAILLDTLWQARVLIEKRWVKAECA